MSLTEADHVFAGLHENAANDFLKAFFTTRPRYLHYGSPFFVPATTVAETQISSIAFPGIPTGIQWEIAFALPVLDFFPDNSPGMPPPLVLDVGMFSVRTKVTLRLGCYRRESIPGGPRFLIAPLETTLGVWAVGRPSVLTSSTPGVGTVGLELEAVEIVDVEPNSLEDLLECLVRMVLQAALDRARIPFKVITAGALKLTLTRGPEIADDQVKIWGDV
jgi:hypothetical protein